MGTNYYKLKKPVTHLSIENACGPTVRVKIWLYHGLAGGILVHKDELSDFIQIFSSDEVAYHSHYGDVEKGKVIKKKQDTNDYIVISEEGKIVKIKDLNKEVKNDIAIKSLG